MDLTTIRSEIERAAAARAAQTSKVVHDLRNLVASTEAAVEMVLLELDEQNIAPEMITQLRSAVASTIEAQYSTLDDLCDLAFIEAHTLPVHREVVSLSALIRTIVQQMSARFAAERCALVVELPPSLLLIWGDPKRLVRALRHILTNALKYAVSHRSDDRKVRISVCQPEAQHIVCQIDDNGCGFAPHDLATLDQQFQLGVGASVSAGSGVGFSFVRGLLSLSGGSVEINSAGSGCGTRVSLYLPLAPVTDDYQQCNGMVVSPCSSDKDCAIISVRQYDHDTSAR